MPVRNASAYLEECLQSIISQTEKQWELLAVNDHSTDNSFEILQTHASKDDRIKVFQNDGKGIIPALQLALKNSNGQFITRMDADDIMLLEKLVRLKNQLLKKGKGHICTALVEYISETPLGDGYKKYQSWLNKLTSKNENFSDIYKECVIPSPCWMVFREDLLQCDAFDSKIYPEDYDLVFRFYKNGLKVTSVLEPLHQWRDYVERSSRTDPNYADQSFLDLKVKYFQELDFDKNRDLVLWGAGKKGKYLARQFQDKSIPFHWISNNERKTGLSISGTILEDIEVLKSISNPQIIIAVAAPNDQKEIENFLKKSNFEKGDHFYFFC